jgi:hypothetical protein
MKLFSRLIVASGILALPFLLANHASAQTYSIDWYKIAGGGGTSTSATYQVSGTIGQTDAGATLTGGNYALTGGFWSLISVIQSSGAPLLTIQQLNATTVKISWPSPSTGFTLQQNSNLATATWATSGFSISDDGTNKSITVSPPTGNLFFRLLK